MDLLRDDLKVALANPKFASIGQLTKEVLSRPGIALWPHLKPRFHSVGTVNEVAQVVRTRPDYVGVVWEALAAQMPGVLVIRPPEFEGVSEPLLLGVLTGSRQPTGALHFARYLTARDRGLVVFRRHHHEPVPDADRWEERPQLYLAAGAMLRPGLDDVVKAFNAREGVTVHPNYAGCGHLVSQMKGLRQAGRPGKFPDAYFACDVSFLDQVQAWFEAPEVVAKNDMVLIVPHGNPKGVRSLEDLTRIGLRVGLPHPKNSALGKLTDDLLRKLGLHGRVYAPDRAVPVVHFDAAHTLVNEMRLGTLDLAVVYRSNARSSPSTAVRDLDVLDVNLPEALATQPFAIARDSEHKYLMKRLLQAIVAPESARRFRSLGFHWVYQTR
jgi:ABC-type molybdate transport system substrate-binding protein